MDLLRRRALEFLYGLPLGVLLEEARVTRECSEADLEDLADAVVADLARVARGEASSLHVPRRLPRSGEHRGRAAEGRPGQEPEGGRETIG